MSQDQPTAPSIGSLASSGSSSARAKVTARHSPSHGSGADGSCSSTKRPEASSSSSPRGADDLGGEGHGIRGDALRSGDLGQPHLGAQPGVPQGAERLRELG